MVTKQTTESQEVAIVQHQGTSVRITWQDVKSLICPLATDQEVAIFLKTCQALQLSPFHNEVFLIKYSEKDKAATVVAIGAYLKAAEVNENYTGHEAGIILRDSGGKLEFREGAFLLEDEMDKLVGGWARVYRKNRDRPTYIAVNKAECVRYTREGKLTQFWVREKWASMLRKTALKRSLVEAFPSLFADTIATTEIADDVPELEEGTLPPALEKGGKPDWKGFWARVKSELGLTPEQARDLLHVDSIKKDLIDQGVSMEKIWDSLVNALQGQKEAARSEQVVDVQTGEITTPPDDLERELFGDDEEAGVAAPDEAHKDEAAANPVFKHYGELAQAAYNLGVTPEQVFKRANVKKWEDFTDFRDAWNWVTEIVMERKQSPKMI